MHRYPFKAHINIFMNSFLSISAEFERQKNLKALTYTFGIVGGLFLLFLFAKMTLPPKELPQQEQYVEIALPDEPPVNDVNLGNNTVGSGKVQPVVTGTPSSAASSQNVSPSPKSANSQLATKDVTTEEHPNSPPVTKPTTANTNKEINNNTDDQTVKNKPVVMKPRAVMTSVHGSGNGGNTDVAGNFKPGGQGPGDGAGDKGVQNGNPKGKKYFGVKEFSIGNQSFQDDFNENAKVAMVVSTDNSGKVISATYTAKGSTGTATSSMIDIARRRAFQLKLGAEEMTGTIIFNFKVR